MFKHQVDSNNMQLPLEKYTEVTSLESDDHNFKNKRLCLNNRTSKTPSLKIRK